MASSTVDQTAIAGFDATYLHLDVADPESWAAARDLVETRHSRLDMPVNNAGIIHVRGGRGVPDPLTRGPGRVCSGPRRSARI